MSSIKDKQVPNLPKEIKFCKKCVMSNQRPRIVFDEEGVCSSCRYVEEKNNVIDWDEREEKLMRLCNKYRSKDGSYDVIVPGSGGKDSAIVTHKLKHKYGMHPLTVTWAPFKYTPIGWKNFRSFLKAGFSNIYGWPNDKLHRKLARLGFELVGDPFLPFIYGQNSYPFHLALKFGIKLVFYGENAEVEYGGDPKNKNIGGLSAAEWVKDKNQSATYFKGINVDELIKCGLEETDYFTKDDFYESDLTFYRVPLVEELEKAGVEMHWFSFYEKWLPQENYYYAAEHTGFEANPDGRSEGTYSKYASLDDQLDGLHYYLMFIKFGIGRATSDAAHEVKDGHITREEGVSLVKRYDGEFPTKYLKESLEYLGITEKKFWEVIDRFRLPHIWKKENGVWRLKKAVYDEAGVSEEIPIYVSSLQERAQ